MPCLSLHSLSFSLPPAPVFTESQDEPRKPSPSKSPQCAPPHTSLKLAPPTPASPMESKHDVPYFRWPIYFIPCILLICFKV